MPVRLLSSSVLRWPDLQMVDRAVRGWAEETAARRPDVLRIGYFGSYARGDWGVGSDLDLIVVVERCEQPPEQRLAAFDATALPVPADVLVYSADEWRSLDRHGRFSQTLLREAVWVYVRDAGDSPGF